MKEKKKSHFFKKLVKFTFVCGFFGMLGILACCFAITNDAALDTDKLTQATSSPLFKILDSNGQKINFISGADANISFDRIPSHTIDAFLTSEDRSFYSHKGIDYKRIAGALVANIKSGKFEQGGSTISQQLIKNTHLSSDKTIERKLKEIKLTKELEKNFSKNKILELYLNTIYFGNGTYGIEEASNFYFSKSASNLTIAESAMLAGIISSPSNNEPAGHFERATKKKELILKNMQKLGKISQKEHQNALNEEIKIKKQSSTNSTQFTKSTINEACRILKINENQLKNKNITIHTNFNQDLSNKIMSSISSASSIPPSPNGSQPTIQVIVLDNNSMSVAAYATNSSRNLENIKRQPGSVIKPILVYAPAFESGKNTPSSFVLDEETQFGTYSPKNSGGKYYGWTSIKNSISKSLNVPAVKTLSYVGVDKAKNFANKLGIDFEPEDNHLALALGGFTKGTTVKEIADAYACFANSGRFSSSSFIQKIVGANGKILYSSHSPSSKAMSEETAYMITDCLMDAAKNGTAKKIMSDGIKIASKTGTTNSNKDAWSASYTKDYTVVTWIGNLDSSKLSTNIKGSSYPTMISRDVFKNLYTNKTCPEFEIPDGIIFAELSSKELEETKLNLAHSQNESKEHVALFTIENLPDFSIQASQIELSLEVQNAKNKPPKLQITHKNAENITIFRENNNKTQKIKEIINPENDFVFEDKTAKDNNLYTYFITAKKGDQSVTSDKIKIRTF